MALIVTKFKSIYPIAGNFRGIKISPGAHTLYWDNKFTNFNFTNYSGALQEVVGGAREKFQCDKIFTGDKIRLKKFRLLHAWAKKEKI